MKLSTIPPPRHNPIHSKLLANTFFVVVCLLTGLFGATHLHSYARHGGSGWILAGSIVSCVASVVGIAIGIKLTLRNKKFARQVDAITSSDGLLGHWSCTPKEWRHYILMEGHKVPFVPAGSGLVLWLFIIGAVGLFYLALMPYCCLSGELEIRVWLWYLAALVALMVVPAALLWIAAEARILVHYFSSCRDVYVSRSGLLVGSRFINWHLGSGDIFRGQVEFV